MLSDQANRSVRSVLTKDQLERASETPNGDLAWELAELPDVLTTAVSSDLAIIGGDVYAVSDGAFAEFFPNTFNCRWWTTGVNNGTEPWTDYCRRTLDESLACVSSLKEIPELENVIGQGVRIAPTFVVRDDCQLMIPRDKHDHARAELAIKAGYPAVGPILLDLLEWLRDMNWPVARTLAPFLASVGLPLAPHLRWILENDDEIWKRWIISELLNDSYELTAELSQELKRIASSPTPAESEEGLDISAKRLLERHNTAP